jgi:hypothetical protein
MKLTRTLALIGVLAILAGYVYFYEIKGGEEREKAKELKEKLFNFESDSVQEIDIRSAFGQFTMMKTEDGWQIKTPVETRADKSTVTGLLNNLKNLKFVRSFPAQKQELKNYGLVGRSLLVLLTFSDSHRDSIWFGDATPVGSNVFAGKGDSLVYTVAAYVKNNADKKLFDWRDKSVAKINQSDVREFKLKNIHGNFHLEKEGSTWKIISPINASADNTPVNAILGKIQNGRIKSVASESLDNPKAFRLSDPAYQIDLYLGESKAHKKIVFSSLKDNVAYGKDDSRPQVFTVDSLFIKDLNKTLFDLRNKKFAEFDRNNIDSLTVVQGDSILTFAKDTSDTWHYGKGMAIKQWKMNSYLSNINNLSAKEFLLESTTQPAKYGLSKPQRSINLYAGKNRVQSVLLNSISNEKKVAYSPVSKITAEIEKRNFDNLEIKINEWLEKKSEDAQ